ncbi:MAG: glycosyltransferase family 4 protein [Bacteroidota bacterium]
MNILFILPEYYPHSGGGISPYYIHYISALKPFCSRIKVIVGSGYTQAYDKFIYDGIEVEYLEPSLQQQYLTKFTKLDLFHGYRNDVAAAWAMWQQAAKGEGFDIIECTDFGLGFIPWVIEHHKPVITRMHGSTGQITLHENSLQDSAADCVMQAELALLPLCNNLITHSSANRNFWLNVFPGANINYIPPVYNNQQTQALPLNERDNNGLVTARLQKWKGPVELCKAVQVLKDPVTIKWFGRDMPYLNNLTTSQYLSENFTGVWNKTVLHEKAIPNAEITILQRKALYGIVPSVWDMFNFTALEFLAAGTPLICSDGAGVADIIEHGKNGFKYPANDINALAKCIEQVLALNSTDYNKIVQAGFKTLDELLSPQALMPPYLKQYTDTIASFSPSNANIFLQKLYNPADKIITLAAVLDKQPLKKLIKYVYKRSLAKLTGTKYQ